LIFVNAAGEMIDQRRLTKRISRVLARAEIETAHGLYDRHSFVTRALEAGRPATEIPGEIGDAVETVLRFYAHQTLPRRGAEVWHTSAVRIVPGQMELNADAVWGEIERHVARHLEDRRLGRAVGDKLRGR
jgi:hypothetical protein